jgi:hypothetical protein
VDAHAIGKPVRGDGQKLPFVGGLKLIAMVALAVELFSGERGHGIDGINIVKVIRVRRVLKPAGACLFQKFPVSGSDAAEVKNNAMAFGAIVKEVHGTGQIAAFAGDAVENATAAIVLKAETVTVNTQAALSVAFPHEDVTETVTGTVGRGFGNMLVV